MAQEIEPEGELVGYCRVSTIEQNLDLQIHALERAGVSKAMIFVEKISGAAKRLPMRERALKMAARPGWTLVVWKLDRLGRSARDVLNIANTLKEAGAYIKTLDGVDTRNKLIGPLLLGMLALVAEFERNMIAERTKAGMAARKAAGQKMGAPIKITPKVKAAILTDLKALELTLEEIAEKHGVSVSGINLDPALKHYRGRVLGQSLRGKRQPGRQT